MPFGRVDSVEDLSSVNFTLPPDHPSTAAILRSSNAKITEVFVGCAK